MKKIKDYSIEELETLKEILENYQDLKKVRKDISRELSNKRNLDMLYRKFHLGMFDQLGIFDTKELEFLMDCSIHNLADLKKYDFSMCQCSQVLKEKINWVCNFYSVPFTFCKKK